MRKKRFDKLLRRADDLIERLDRLLPTTPAVPDWTADAYRWQQLANNTGRLEAIQHPQTLRLDDLLCMEHQKAELVRNTRCFVAGHRANNVLLWGSRGTGKSSLIKALLPTYREQGLRLIEVNKQDLLQLPEILYLLQERHEYYVLYCDDLSFGAHESGYKALKVVLEGSLGGLPDNLLIYATSNRRHLLPEFQSENEHSHMVDAEIHHGESVEEKISLSERFGLWLSFYPFNQDEYLEITTHWLRRFDLALNEEARDAALRWALQRGSRSGRVAYQFAIDYANR